MMMLQAPALRDRHESGAVQVEMAFPLPSPA